MMEDEPKKTAEDPIELDDDLDFGKTVLQFFVVPAIVVAVCVGIFFFFAWLVSDEKTGVDYLNEIRAGSDVPNASALFGIPIHIAAATADLSDLATDPFKSYTDPILQ